MNPKAQLPAVSYRSAGLKIILSQDLVPTWAKSEGMLIESVGQAPNGSLAIRCIPDRRPLPTIRKVQGSWEADKNRHVFAFTNAEVMGDVPFFGVVHVGTVTGDDSLVLTLPADRPPVGSKTKKPKRVPMTEREAAERVQRMMGTPEPADETEFRPAIPLREAVEAINRYKADEGEALKLAIEKGRLKVKLEYGG